MTRVAWNGEPEWRTEVCELQLGEDGLAATGAQLGADPRPYRAAYELEARKGWVTRRLRVEVGGARLARAAPRRQGQLGGGRERRRARGRARLRPRVLAAHQPDAGPPPPAARATRYGRLRDGLGLAARPEGAPRAAALRAPRPGARALQRRRGLHGRPRARRRRASCSSIRGWPGESTDARRRPARDRHLTPARGGHVRRGAGHERRRVAGRGAAGLLHRAGRPHRGRGPHAREPADVRARRR